MIVGSANYTIESQKLVETSVLFDINSNTWQEEERKFQALWAKGADLAASTAQPSRALPSAPSELERPLVSEPVEDPMSTPIRHKFSPSKSTTTIQAHDHSPTAPHNHTTAVRSRAKGKKVDARRQLFPCDADATFRNHPTDCSKIRRGGDAGEDWCLLIVGISRLLIPRYTMLSLPLSRLAQVTSLCNTGR